MNSHWYIVGLLLLAGLGQPALAADSAPAVQSTGAPANAPAQAKLRIAPDSLMFTPDELTDIQGHSAGAGSATSARGGRDAIEDATLYLSTILYASPNDWTIWINGVALSANQEFKSFQITQITPNSVDLLVPLSVQGMRPIHLQPNQTFITKTGVVVEGKYP